MEKKTQKIHCQKRGKKTINGLCVTKQMSTDINVGLTIRRDYQGLCSVSVKDSVVGRRMAVEWNCLCQSLPAAGSCRVLDGTRGEVYRTEDPKQTASASCRSAGRALGRAARCTCVGSCRWQAPANLWRFFQDDATDE